MSSSGNKLPPLQGGHFSGRRINSRDIQPTHNPRGLGFTIFLQATTRKGGGGGVLPHCPKGSISGGRDVCLARKAALAVLQSGPWSPERNRELVVLQVRFAFKPVWLCRRCRYLRCCYCFFTGNNMVTACISFVVRLSDRRTMCPLHSIDIRFESTLCMNTTYRPGSQYHISEWALRCKSVACQGSFEREYQESELNASHWKPFAARKS